MARSASDARLARAALLRGLALLSVLLLAGCSRACPERRLVIAHPRPLSSVGLFGARHDRTALNILANVYEPLVERGPDLAIRPRLAESWYSPDERTWVFKLRQGVLRHDGRVLTTGDVVASFEHARKDPWAAGALAPVSDVRARGDSEIVFTTREPFDALPARLVYIFVTGQPEPGGATGPYRLRPGTAEDSIVLEAFPGYRSGRAPIAVVEFRVVRDPHERARRLLSHEAGLIEDIVPDDMKALRAAPGVRTLALPGFTTAFLAMDTAKGAAPDPGRPANPFQDPRVREAMDLAVDRRALVSGPLLGYAEATDQLALPGQEGFVSSLEPTRQDVSGARSLLRQAGFAGGFDVPLDYVPGTLDGVVAMLGRQLEAVGIRLRARSNEPDDFLARLERHDTPLYLLRWVQPSEAIEETYTWLLHSPHGELGTMNGGGYSSPRLDQLLENGLGRHSKTRRGELLREATLLVHADRPILVLYRQNDLHAFSEDLDFRPQPHEQFNTLLWRMRWTQ
jgi:peptide/nickel transport system substrate-binding protein